MFQIGLWLGGFVIPFAVGYIFLRLAEAPGRKPNTATVLRLVAVVLAAFFSYAGAAGGGSLNIGSVAAFVYILVWAVRQQTKHRDT